MIVISHEADFLEKIGTIGTRIEALIACTILHNVAEVLTVLHHELWDAESHRGGTRSVRQPVNVRHHSTETTVGV